MPALGYNETSRKAVYDEVEVSVALSAPPASADDLGEEIGGRYTDLADRIGVPLC